MSVTTRDVSELDAFVFGLMFAEEGLGEIFAVPIFAIPEPSTLLLAAWATMLLGFRRRRRAALLPGA